MKKETVTIKRKYHFEGNPERMVFDESIREFIARINNVVQYSNNIIDSLDVKINGKESDVAILKVNKFEIPSDTLILIQCYKKVSEDENDVNKLQESYPSYLTSYNYKMGGEGFGIQYGTRDALKFVNLADAEEWMKKAEETFENYEFSLIEIDRKFFGKNVLIPYIVLSNRFKVCDFCKSPIFIDSDNFVEKDGKIFHDKCFNALPNRKIPICPFCKKEVNEINGDDLDVDDLGRICHHTCLEEYMERMTEEDY